jgi:hypothetical protein
MASTAVQAPKLTAMMPSAIAMLLRLEQLRLWNDETLRLT